MRKTIEFEEANRQRGSLAGQILLKPEKTSATAQVGSPGSL
jgi:hypothetical protein